MPAKFGTARLNTVDPDFKRVYNLETTAGIQHELLPRVSVSANWYRRTFHHLRVTDNLLRTQADYTPFSIFHPITGQPFTVYDVSAAAVSRVENFDTNSDRAGATSTTPSTSNINTRLPGGAMLFGGFVTERNLRNICDEPDDPEHAALLRRLRRTTFRTGRRSSCRGRIRLPWGFSVSGTWQDLAGRPLGSDDDHGPWPRRTVQTRSAARATATPAAPSARTGS